MTTTRTNRRRRIRRPVTLLKSLRLLRIRVERASERAETIEEKAWCRSLADALDRQITAGDAVLPPSLDPRPGRIARKRRLQFEEPAS